LPSTCELLNVLTKAPVNAEVSGGGFPGWLSRTSDILRTNETGYLEATQNYVENIGKIIAEAQITNGGPVIAFQAENEYTFGMSWVEWPDVKYIDAVNQQFRDTGIVVPFSMFTSPLHHLEPPLTHVSQQ
jgi:beta-galactosidase